MTTYFDCVSRYISHFHSYISSHTNDSVRLLRYCNTGINNHVQWLLLCLLSFLLTVSTLGIRLEKRGARVSWFKLWIDFYFWFWIEKRTFISEKRGKYNLGEDKISSKTEKSRYNKVHEKKIKNAATLPSLSAYQEWQLP